MVIMVLSSFFAILINMIIPQLVIDIHQFPENGKNMKQFPGLQFLITCILQGIAMGCVVGGFGGGALVFNFIQVTQLHPGDFAI